MRAAAILLAGTLLAAGALPARAIEIVGNYDCEGTGSASYRCRVAVERSGDTYLVNWNIGGAKNVGTGILRGRVFSVVYGDEAGHYGLAVYEIRDQGVLEGTYTPLGGTAVGTETWTMSPR